MPDLQQQFDRLTEDVDPGRFVDPASIRRRGDRRTRRQVVGGAVALAAIVAAGAIVTVDATGGDSKVDPLDTPTPSVSVSPNPEPSATATATKSDRGVPLPTTVPGPGQVLIGPLQLDIPIDWESVDTRFDHACIQPVATRPGAFGCAGLDVSWGWNGYLPGQGDISFSRSDANWYHALDVQPCPVDPGSGKDYNGITDEGQLDAEQTAPVGDRTAYSYSWTGAQCASGYPLNPRAWYLPTSHVVMFDYIGYDDLNPIVENAAFDDGAWKLGYLRGSTHVDGSSQWLVDFDEATWLSGDEAQQYAREHGQEVLNDYVLVNPDTSTTQLPIAVDDDPYRFQLLGGAPDDLRGVALDRLLTFIDEHAEGYPVFHVHVDAAGVIDRVLQQYTP